MLTNLLLIFAALARWQTCLSQFYPTVHAAYTGAKLSTIEWLELIKPLGREEYRTRGSWNSFLLQMVWLGNFVWNESRRNTSWLEPQAQMAARHEWSCMDGRLILHFPPRPATLQIPCFPWEAMFLKKTTYPTEWKLHSVLNEVLQ